MTSLLKTSILFAAAAAVPLLLPGPASAQYRINQDGHALDVNNRANSGGYNSNDSWKRVGEPVNGNAIVTGNVSGGKEFRGQIQYTDPRAFRGASTGINLDNFVKNSAGPDSRLTDSPQPFYGAGRAVPPPTGYVPAGAGTGAYIPNQTPTVRAPGDTRIGALDLNNQPLPLPMQGQLILPGQVDPTAGQTFITASPTAGIRSFTANDLTGLTANTQYNPPGMRFDQNSIEQMRNEMNAAAGIVPAPGGMTANPTMPGTDNQANPTPGANSPAPGGNAPGTPGAAQPAGGAPASAVPIVQQPIASATAQQRINTQIAAVPGDMSTDQGTRQRLNQLLPPEKQSSTYADLLKRYQQSLNDRSVSDAQAARDFNALQRAQNESNAAGGASGQPGNAAAPGATGSVAIPPPPGQAAPGAAAPGAGSGVAANVPDFAKKGEDILRNAAKTPEKGKKPTAAKAEPVKVPSLATGMKGKGMEEMMKNAEQSMRDGKFTAALDSYDKAEQVAPNNPLIKLGRANAELGASYYARAEAHLREVFTGHPELLVAQYDLASMLGEQRLQALVRDLKDIVRRDQKEARPLFLLSYIAYNTGHPQEAQAYLDLADKRADGKDRFYSLLRENWALPGSAAGPTTRPELTK